jgi:hypothetical protein
VIYDVAIRIAEQAVKPPLRLVVRHAFRQRRAPSDFVAKEACLILCLLDGFDADEAVEPPAARGDVSSP